MKVKRVTVEATKGPHYQVLGEYVEGYSDTLFIDTMVSFMRAEGWTVKFVSSWLDLSDKQSTQNAFPVVCCAEPNCLTCYETGQCPNCGGYSVTGVCYLKISEIDKNAYIRELLRKITELQSKQMSIKKGAQNSPSNLASP